ncbi:unnamed protein product [Ixodes hexagonus]
MVQVMETTLSSTGAEGQPLLCNGVAGPPGGASSWPEQGAGDCVSPLHDGYRKVLNRRDKNGDLLGSDAVISIELAAPERSEPRIVQEKWKTLVAFSFLSGNLILNLTCLAVVHERIPDRTKYPPLPDIFFDLFPPLDWALDVSEVIIIVCIWSTLLLLLIHRYRWIVLQRVFLIMGLLYFMRSITMFVTQVPVASTTYYCSPKANTTNPLLILKRVAQLLSGFGLSINGQHTFCGDYIYSGHTVILTLAYLVVRECDELYGLIWKTIGISLFKLFKKLIIRTIYVISGEYIRTGVLNFRNSLCTVGKSFRHFRSVLSADFHFSSSSETLLSNKTPKNSSSSVTSTGLVVELSLETSLSNSAFTSSQLLLHNASQGHDMPALYSVEARDDSALFNLKQVPTNVHDSADSTNLPNETFSHSCHGKHCRKAKIWGNKNPSQNNYLARTWWFPIFSYFEKNVGAVVPRQYEWPLPWPRRWLPRTRIS